MRDLVLPHNEAAIRQLCTQRDVLLCAGWATQQDGHRRQGGMGAPNTGVHHPALARHHQLRAGQLARADVLVGQEAVDTGQAGRAEALQSRVQPR